MVLLELRFYMDGNGDLQVAKMPWGKRHCWTDLVSANYRKRFEGYLEFACNTK